MQKQVKKLNKKITKREYNKLLKKMHSEGFLTKKEKKKLEKYNIQQSYSLEMIDYGLDTAGLVPEYARTPLAKALSLLPHEVIDFVTEHCYFISQEKGTDGSYHDFDSFHKKAVGFILIPEEIWGKKPIQIAFTIAHEVAHALKRNKPLDKGFKKIGELLQYVPKQEKEADRLAVKWLSRHYSKKSLMKLCGYLKSPRLRKDSTN